MVTEDTWPTQAKESHGNGQSAEGLRSAEEVGRGQLRSRQQALPVQRLLL